MTTRFALALICLAACAVGPVVSESSSGSSSGVTDAPAAAGPAVRPERASKPSPTKVEEPSAAVASVDASALEIPHDMPPLDADCMTRRNFALSQVGDAVEFASAGCSVDADCVRAVNSTGCRGQCGAAVLATHEEAYEALRSSVDERVCSTYRDDACPYAAPRCAKTAPRCVEGRCEMAW